MVTVTRADVKPEDAKAQIKVSGSKSELVLKVIAPSGTELNFQGPWKLVLDGEVPVKSGEKQFDVSKFDKTKDQFVVALNEEKAATWLKAPKKGDYKITYFICSKEHTWCKREMAEGTIAF
jgi:hypothetical protein